MTKAKKKINSRTKGASFERKVAKLLGDWWGCDAHRVPLSGGLHWKEDNRVHGDIVMGIDATDYPFCNECKKVEGWNFEQVIKGTGQVTDWWAQCCRDASAVDAIPLLTFSKNRSPIYYMLYEEHWRPLELPRTNCFLTTIVLDGEEHRVAVGLFDDLLQIPKEKVSKTFMK